MASSPAGSLRVAIDIGGTFTDLNGTAVGLETRSVLAANAGLYDSLLQQLRGWVV